MKITKAQWKILAILSLILGGAFIIGSLLYNGFYIDDFLTDFRTYIGIIFVGIGLFLLKGDYEER